MEGKADQEFIRLEAMGPVQCQEDKKKQIKKKSFWAVRICFFEQVFWTLVDLLYDPSQPMANVWSELRYPSFFNVLIIKTIPSFITWLSQEFNLQLTEKIKQ